MVRLIPNQKSVYMYILTTLPFFGMSDGIDYWPVIKRCDRTGSRPITNAEIMSACARIGLKHSEFTRFSHFSELFQKLRTLAKHEKIVPGYICRVHEYIRNKEIMTTRYFVTFSKKVFGTKSCIFVILSKYVHFQANLTSYIRIVVPFSF